MHHSHDLVERFGKHRIPGTPGHCNFVGRRLDGQVGIEGDHLGPGRHDFLSRLLAELEHSLQQAGVFLKELSALGALLH